MDYLFVGSGTAFSVWGCFCIPIVSRATKGGASLLFSLNASIARGLPAAVRCPSASAFAVNENQAAVNTLSADEAVTWAIIGGADSARFQISAAGVITFSGSPDFEAPTDSDTNNTHLLTNRATDGNGNTSTQTITVIETAKLNGIEPQAFIVDVIARIAAVGPAAR